MEVSANPPPARLDDHYLYATGFVPDGVGPESSFFSLSSISFSVFYPCVEDHNLDDISQHSRCILAAAFHGKFLLRQRESRLIVKT